MSAAGRRRAGMGALVALAGVGVYLAVEGGLRGDARHRLVAVAVGGACVVPLVMAVVFGARGRAVVARMALAMGAAVVALGMAEVTVRVLDVRALVPEELVDDPVLGHRLMPERGEVDAWGFRNVRVPERAEVVCLGDSQTYGVSVGREEAWPAVLGRETGLGVYNAGLGGYGPLQYVALFEQVLELEPRVVVVALYLGNDVADAYAYAGLEHWAEWRKEGVEYVEPEVRRPDPRSANAALAVVDGAMEGSRVLGALGEAVKRRLKQAAALESVYWSEDGEPGYARAPLATRFTPEYRFGAVDVGRESVKEGLRLTKLALARIAERARAEGVVVVVVLVPTKERCYREMMVRRGEGVPEAVERLARAESEVAREIGEAVGVMEIEVVDAAQALVEALVAGRAMWPPGPDGHFDRGGNEVVAGVVAGVVGRR